MKSPCLRLTLCLWQRDPIVLAVSELAYQKKIKYNYKNAAVCQNSDLRIRNDPRSRVQSNFCRHQGQHNTYYFAER